MEPVKVKRRIANPVCVESELSTDIGEVFAAFDHATEQLKRCRRVMVANAALHNAKRRLQERLAEFRGDIVKVDDVW